MIHPVPDATRRSESVINGETTPLAIAESMIERILAQEPDIQAFVSFDTRQVRADAAQNKGQGLLAGVPVGIKDIFDTAEYPTLCVGAGHPDRWLIAQAGVLLRPLCLQTGIANPSTPCSAPLAGWSRLSALKTPDRQTSSSSGERLAGRRSICP